MHQSCCNLSRFKLFPLGAEIMVVQYLYYCHYYSYYMRQLDGTRVWC